MAAVSHRVIEPSQPLQRCFCHSEIPYLHLCQPSEVNSISAQAEVLCFQVTLAKGLSSLSSLLPMV